MAEVARSLRKANYVRTLPIHMCVLFGGAASTSCRHLCFVSDISTLSPCRKPSRFQTALSRADHSTSLGAVPLMLGVLIHLGRFLARVIRFGLLSTSRTAVCETGIPLFLKGIGPPAHHDPWRPTTTICRPASEARSQRRTHRTRTGPDCWGLATAYAQRSAWKAQLFDRDHRRHDAPITSGRTRPDRTQRMGGCAQANLNGESAPHGVNVLKLETEAYDLAKIGKCGGSFRR